jgi:hypothetical protein
MHVWGCPVYVLDPTLQQGSKLPKWQPRSRRGIFVGFSPAHSSDVPLILNTQTGHISPQFHVVFDDNFSTVNSLTSDDEPPPFWNDFDIGEFLYRIELDDDTPAVYLLIGSLLPKWRRRNVLVSVLFDFKTRHHQLEKYLSHHLSHLFPLEEFLLGLPFLEETHPCHPKELLLSQM